MYEDARGVHRAQGTCANDDSACLGPGHKIGPDEIRLGATGHSGCSAAICRAMLLSGQLRTAMPFHDCYVEQEGPVSGQVDLGPSRLQY